MSEIVKNSSALPVAVVIGATSKWQADGRNTRLVHRGEAVKDDEVALSARWGAGGAIAQKFAQEGFFVVMTTRTASNASALEQAIRDQGGAGMIVELELGSRESVAAAFDRVRGEAGEPEVVIYNAGYMEGRDLPPEMELMEFFPAEMFERTIDVSCRGPFLVAKEVLPAMRRRGSGSLFFSNNPLSLRGQKRYTGESLYYPRGMMRATAQALTEEYSEHGIHVATVIINGSIDSPGIHGHPEWNRHIIDPAKIADAFYYLHTQDRSCWTHEMQLTPWTRKPAF